MWPDSRVEQFVTSEFKPVRVHVKDHADEFRRLGEKYGAQWTPDILMIDHKGEEQHRIEGFLPLDEFLPQLMFGRARIDFSNGKFAEAEQRFDRVVQEFPNSDAAPESLYWRGVSKYKASNDPSALHATASAFEKQYQNSTWAMMAWVWRQDSSKRS